MSDGSPAADPPPQARTAADFTAELLCGTKQNGLNWRTIEDLFQAAMDEGRSQNARLLAEFSSDRLKGRSILR